MNTTTARTLEELKAELKNACEAAGFEFAPAKKNAAEGWFGGSEGETFLCVAVVSNQPETPKRVPFEVAGNKDTMEFDTAAEAVAFAKTQY